MFLLFKAGVTNPTLDASFVLVMDGTVTFSLLGVALASGAAAGVPSSFYCIGRSAILQ